MRTRHTLLIGDARRLTGVASGSVHLVVTSPPYPMIAMWDEAFTAMDPAVGPLLAEERGWEAFARMHACLDEVWAELRRVVVPGGLVCINVGDATRSLAGAFALYPNHARIITGMLALGFTPLPDILWHKPTNAPNKFMGSGMLPGGAYVTYEHEYVLVFRNGDKRAWSTEEQAARSASAYFWEERNVWFSDLWTGIRGVGQRVTKEGVRERSGAFPWEVPYRLIQMYSVQGDTVLDPFVGTGTTLAAALGSGRSSVGCELVAELRGAVGEQLVAGVGLGRARLAARLEAHRAFVLAREAQGKAPGHVSAAYGFPVMTRQEVGLRLAAATAVERVSGDEGGDVYEAECEGA